MGKRCIGRLGLIGISVLFCFIISVWKLAPLPGITVENMNRVRFRMNVDEVEAIFGGPCVESEMLRPGIDKKLWIGDGVKVEVAFSDGEAVQIIYNTSPIDSQWENHTLSPDDGILKTIRRWVEGWWVGKGVGH
jgi:hypothetical protein